MTQPSSSNATNKKPSDCGQSNSERPASAFRRFSRQCVRRIKQTVVVLVVLTAIYAIIVGVGTIPVNADFQTAGDNGIPIFVYSGPVHSDLILPVDAGGTNWLQSVTDAPFKKSVAALEYVAIGWGERGFYLETPTWSDLRASVAINAILLPSKSVMHVGFCRKPKPKSDIRQVRLTPQQYERLVRYIQASFSMQDGQVVPIKGESYGSYDAFFEADGNYHAFNTCNCWVANGLEQAGVKVPWFSPMPRTVLWYLPDDAVDRSVAPTLSD